MRRGKRAVSRNNQEKLAREGEKKRKDEKKGLRLEEKS